MAFRFAFDHGLADEVRRLADRQFQRLSRATEPADDAVKAVHEARKAIKRLRALLGLVQPASPRRLKKLDRRLRKLARAMASTRDRDVLAPTYRALIEHYGRSDTEWPRISAALIAMSPKVSDDAPSLTYKSLDRCRAAVLALPLERLDESDLASAAAATYRLGRRALKRLGPQSSADDFHDWRKSVQRHWRHMQILENAWPPEMAARQRLSHDLAQALGDDHDLHMLQVWLSASTARLKEAVARRRLETLIATRQQELRRHSMRLGRRLYAESPAAFERRLAVYFATRDPAAAQMVVEPERRPSNHVVPFARPV